MTNPNSIWADAYHTTECPHCGKEHTALHLEHLVISERNARLKDLLRKIGYPTHEEEIMDIHDAANLIQCTFSLEDLA